MKKLFFLGMLFPICLVGQNIDDAYSDHTGQSRFSDFIPPGWDGEYQVFLKDIYWNSIYKNYNQAAKSFKMEIVSFPFIPKYLDDNDTNTKVNLHSNLYDYRCFDVQLAEGYSFGELEQHYNQGGDVYDYWGWGWDYGYWNIFSKIKNNYICDDEGVYKMCKGDYGLISAGFYVPIPCSNDNQKDVWFPHTIIKHTVYFHCGPSLEDNIVDSLYWIYDNTRGTMKGYPFVSTNGGGEFNDFINPTIDVCFRPTFMNCNFVYNPLVQITNHPDYDSGWQPPEDASGSVNYFPPEEVLENFDVCETYELYYNPNQQPINSGFLVTPSWKYVDHIHPCSYALLDAPLLNANGQYWAGYDASGSILEGKEHVYEINNSIDLTLINPYEKIIYNPSHVFVNANLTFPRDYKFLTLHGKYPDKDNEVLKYYEDYWYNKPFIFEFERYYPTPVNKDINAEPWSTYQLNNRIAITIEPCTIIMNAKFIGTDKEEKGILICDTNAVYGNWKYDKETIEIIQLAPGPDCGEEPIPDRNNTNAILFSHQVSTRKKEFIRVYNNPSKNVNIELIDPSRFKAPIIQIIDSFGNKIKMIVNPQEAIHLCDYKLSSGIYLVLLYDMERRLESKKVIITY
ncbi:MAG: T9SS type A sorting domain-containing protein [Bacteroidetes bacterium]|nr:T9SS type A sorting domain-containing protein [Bacteroidota bacterium]